MAGQVGLFVARDGSNNGTTPKGARLALGGLLSGNGAYPLDVRTGVLVDAGGVVVSGLGSMSYFVRAFCAVTAASASNGPTVVANDSSVVVATTAAPGSNSRIDVIWVRQHHVAGDGATDPDVTCEIGVTNGTAAAVPAVPAIPTGALSLAQVTVPSGTVATNTLTFTRTFKWTAANGSVIPMTTTERDALSGVYNGRVIFNETTSTLQTYISGTWVSAGGGQANPIWFGVLTATDTAITTNVETAITTWSVHAVHSRPGTGNFSYSAGVLTCLKTGMYRVDARVKWSSDPDSYRDLYLKIDGTAVVASTLPAGAAKVSLSIDQPLYLTAGQTLSLSVKHNGGSGISVDGSATTLPSIFSVSYLGTAAV